MTLRLELSPELARRLQAATEGAGAMDPEAFAARLLDASLQAVVPVMPEGDETITYRRSPSFSLTWDG